jgi:hypothetical protein
VYIIRRVGVCKDSGFWNLVIGFKHGGKVDEKKAKEFLEI